MRQCPRSCISARERLFRSKSRDAPSGRAQYGVVMHSPKQMVCTASLNSRMTIAEVKKTPHVLVFGAVAVVPLSSSFSAALAQAAKLGAASPSTITVSSKCLVLSRFCVREDPLQYVPQSRAGQPEATWRCLICFVVRSRERERLRWAFFLSGSLSVF